MLNEVGILLRDIGDDNKLNHWIWEQDFLVDNDGEAYSGEIIKASLMDAGANNQQINKILRIVHKEDQRR